MASTRARANRVGGTSLFRAVAADLAAVGRPVTAVDPRIALLDTVSLTWQMVHILQQLVSALPVADLEHLGMEQLDIRMVGSGGGPLRASQVARAVRRQNSLLDRQSRAARARSVIDLYGEWLDRAGKLSAATIRAGVEDRLVRLAEAQSVIVVEAVREALDALPLEPGQRQAAIVSIAERLRRSALEAPPLLEDPAAVLARLEATKEGRNGKV